MIWLLGYGVWVVAIGSMFAGIGGAMVVGAGAIRFNFVKFLIADGMAAIVSGGLFIWLGHWLGSKLKEHMEDVKRYKEYVFVALGAVVILTIVLIVWQQRRKRRGKPTVVDAAIAEASGPAEDAHPLFEPVSSDARQPMPLPERQAEEK